MIPAQHPFAVRQLNVTDEWGNEGCARCGRTRAQHPEPLTAADLRLLRDFRADPPGSPWQRRLLRDVTY